MEHDGTPLRTSTATKQHCNTTWVAQLPAERRDWARPLSDRFGWKALRGAKWVASFVAMACPKVYDTVQRHSSKTLHRK